MRSSPHLNAVDRVRRRVKLFLDEERHKPLARRMTQVRLADKLGVNKSTLNEWLHGREAATQGTLAHLDALADAVGLSPAELVQSYRSTLMELSPNEQVLIRHWRAWPRAVRASVFRLLRYWSDLLPEEAGNREFVMLLRSLDGPSQQAVLNQLRDTVTVAQRAQSARRQANALAAPDRTVETATPSQIRKMPT